MKLFSIEGEEQVAGVVPRTVQRFSEVW